MARRPERNFFEQLRRNLPKLGIPLHLQRVENTATVGTPDVNYCLAGTEGWVELKAWERVRFTGRFTVPKLRPEQAAWLAARCAAGGRAYLLARINRDVVLIDGRYTPLLYDKELHLDWQHGRTIAACWVEMPTNWKTLADALQAPPVPNEVIQANRKLFTKRVA